MRLESTKMFVFVAATLLFASCVNDEQYYATVDSSISQGTPEAPAKSDFIITIERQDGGINLDNINLHLLGRIEGEKQGYSLQRLSAISFYLNAITFVSGIDLNF